MKEGERESSLSYTELSRVTRVPHRNKGKLERQEWVDRKGHGVPSVTLARTGQPLKDILPLIFTTHKVFPILALGKL